MARDDTKYPIAKILAAADLVGRGPSKRSDLGLCMNDADAAVRFWAVIGLRCLGDEAKPTRVMVNIEGALTDPSPPVRIEAAGALAALGEPAKAVTALRKELGSDSQSAVLRAVRTLELMGEAARPAAADVKAVLASGHAKTEPLGMFVAFSAQALLEALGEA
jgi:HEAT repeat protein